MVLKPLAYTHNCLDSNIIDFFINEMNEVRIKVLNGNYVMFQDQTVVQFSRYIHFFPFASHEFGKTIVEIIPVQNSM